MFKTVLLLRFLFCEDFETSSAYQAKGGFVCQFSRAVFSSCVAKSG